MAYPNSPVSRDKEMGTSAPEILKASAGIKASKAGVLKTENIAYNPQLRVQLAAPTQITKEMNRIARK